MTDDQTEVPPGAVEALQRLTLAVAENDRAATADAMDAWYDAFEGTGHDDAGIRLVRTIVVLTVNLNESKGGEPFEELEVTQHGVRIDPDDLTDPDGRGAVIALRALIARQAGQEPLDHLATAASDEEVGGVVSALLGAFRRVLLADQQPAPTPPPAPTPAGGPEQRAMAVRSVLIREGPWISDGIWIAHHTHPLFGRMHQLLPTNGVWRLTEHGPQPEGVTPSKRLEEFITEAMDYRRPCVIGIVPDTTVDPDNLQLTDAGGPVPKLFAVVDETTGDVHEFDANYTSAFDIYAGDDWTWHLTNIGDQVMLLGTDRKNRPRFLVPSVITTVVEEPAA